MKSRLREAKALISTRFKFAPNHHGNTIKRKIGKRTLACFCSRVWTLPRAPIDMSTHRYSLRLVDPSWARRSGPMIVTQAPLVHIVSGRGRAAPAGGRSEVIGLISKECPHRKRWGEGVHNNKIMKRFMLFLVSVELVLIEFVQACCKA